MADDKDKSVWQHAQDALNWIGNTKDRMRQQSLDYLVDQGMDVNDALRAANSVGRKVDRTNLISQVVAGGLSRPVAAAQMVGMGQDIGESLMGAGEELGSAVQGRAKGGRLLQDQYPTHYMPHVGRQVMQDGGDPKDVVNKALALTSGAQPSAQTVANLVKRGQPIAPPTADPTDEELAAARADTRVGNQIVAQRLNKIVPESKRVYKGQYTPGAPGGGRWSDLGDEVLSRPGAGFNVKDKELQQLWDEAVNESSAAAKKAAKDFNVRPTFHAKDWDQAMRLPLKDHLWYELSGEKMAENLPDLSGQEFMRMMDLVGATSARAAPDENLERALAAMSQHLRGAPIDVDLTQPDTVNRAISRMGQESSALPGNKTGQFSDTLTLAGGVPTRFPISVNDVWVGKMFGVPDKVMSSNQSLHEPMAIYFNKLRDMYNERHGHEVPFDYQSWNFQAPAWVHLRNKEANAESGDAYHQVWGKIIGKLQNAGVEGIDGDKITRQAMMDPRFADALRRTTQEFREAPKATVELGTKLTPTGLRAHELYKQAIAAGDDKTQKDYEKALVTAMYASARGKGHGWELLKKAITGDLSNKSDITRIVQPTADDPFTHGGTYENEMSPNIRIPLKGMTPQQIQYFNAIAGKHLNQGAMAASQVLPVDPNQVPRDGYVRGHSVFVPTTDGMKKEDIRKFASEINRLGHSMSYTSYPNGYVFDINPQFTDDGVKGIDHNTLADAYDVTLAPKYGKPALFAHDYKSEYQTQPEYGKLRTKLMKEMNDDFIKEAVQAGTPKDYARRIGQGSSLPSDVSKGTAKAWDRYRGRLYHLLFAEKEFQDLAKRVEDAHGAFIPKAEARLAKLAKSQAPQTPPAAPEEPTPTMAEGGTVHEPHQRAEEQGYSIKGYHVTRGPRAKGISSSGRFSLEHAENPGEEAIFFWDNPEAANDWAHALTQTTTFNPDKMTERDKDRFERHQTSILPVRINPGNHAEVDWPSFAGTHSYNTDAMSKLISHAQDQNIDTLRIKNMQEDEYKENPPDQIAVLNPRLIRSEYAKFDPARQHENDIGAATGGEVN